MLITGVSTIYWNKRNHVLRPCIIQHLRIRRQCILILSRYHGSGKRPFHHRLHLLRRQTRKTHPPPPGRSSDVPISGHHRHHPRPESQRPFQPLRPRVRNICSYTRVYFRIRLRLVMGPTRVAHTIGDLPVGNPVSRSECDRLYEHALHFRHWASLLIHAL